MCDNSQKGSVSIRLFFVVIQSLFVYSTLKENKTQILFQSRLLTNKNSKLPLNVFFGASLTQLIKYRELYFVYVY